MKCMIIRKADKDTEAEKMPGQDLLLAMGKYNERLVDAGVMADGAGLKPSKYGARIHFEQGMPVVTNGPFAETHELVAGYTMLETDTFEEALEWAKQWPPEDNGVLELRPLFGVEDFEQGEGLAKHQELAQKLARRPSAITPFLEFSGGVCRAAFEHYAASLGGEIVTMMTWGEIPMETGVEGAKKDYITHATLTIGRMVIAGIDILDESRKGPIAGHLMLNFATPEQTRAAYEALVEGGTAMMAPHATFWTTCFAVLIDRFGVKWSLNCEEQPASNPRD